MHPACHAGRPCVPAAAAADTRPRPDGRRPCRTPTSSAPSAQPGPATKRPWPWPSRPPSWPAELQRAAGTTPAARHAGGGHPEHGRQRRPRPRHATRGAYGCPHQCYAGSTHGETPWYPSTHRKTLAIAEEAVAPLPSSRFPASRDPPHIGALALRRGLTSVHPPPKPAQAGVPPTGLPSHDITSKGASVCEAHSLPLHTRLVRPCLHRLGGHGC